MKNNNQMQSGPVKPKWSMKLIPIDYDDEEDDDQLMEYDGFNFNREEASGFEIEIELPLMTTGKHFNLQSSGKFIHLRCARFYELNINVPISYKKNELQALFDIEKRILTLKGLFTEIEQIESDDEDSATQEST